MKGTSPIVVPNSGIAIFSACNRYRFELHRRLRVDSFADRGILWVMLNPSTADASKSDPTVTRCMTFSAKWGYPRFMVGNAYALRSTDPKGLWEVPDPVGRGNDAHIRSMGIRADLVMVAWGGNIKPERARKVLDVLALLGPVHALRVNADGTPAHPLYLPSNLEPVEYVA